MGFFKKFFSLGSKKSRRKHAARQAEHIDADGKLQADGEATRLLRSASAHFAVVSHIDDSLLPPLALPANATAPRAPSPVTSAASIQRRGTYTVKVLERRVEACTAFPNANLPLRDEKQRFDGSPPRPRVVPHEVPFTPHDKSRLLRLRQDPSVASLLNMYDDNGRISSAAFSNSPQTPITHDVGGREQVKRSGSTLRQLLGDKRDSQGDISWAERFLCEHAGSTTSLASTNPVETPKDTLSCDVPFSNPSTQILVGPEFSQDTFAHQPAISSMEVELSNATVAHIDHKTQALTSSKGPGPQKPPKKAAEVFGFVIERRKSILERQRSQSDRLSAFTRSSSEIKAIRSSTLPPPVPPKSTDTSDTSLTLSAHIQTATVTKLIPVTNPLRRSSDAPLLYSHHTGSSASLSRLLQNADSAGSQANSDSTTAHLLSKIPRGPRPLPVPGQIPRPSSKSQRHGACEAPGNLKGVQHASTKGEHSSHRSRPPKQSQAPTTPSRSRQQRRVTSRPSGVVSGHNDEEAQHAPVVKKSRKPDRVQRNKENSPPVAPTSRAIFDMRHPNLTNGEPPSPASSSDLSPYTKEMMMTLRKQRARARDEMHGSRSRRHP